MRLADTIDNSATSHVILAVCGLAIVALFAVGTNWGSNVKPVDQEVTPISPETALEQAAQEIVKDINYGLSHGQRSYPAAPAPGHRAADEFRKRGWVVNEDRKDGVVWLRFEWAETEK